MKRLKQWLLNSTVNLLPPLPEENFVALIRPYLVDSAEVDPDDSLAIQASRALLKRWRTDRSRTYVKWILQTFITLQVFPADCLLPLPLNHFPDELRQVYQALTDPRQALSDHCLATLGDLVTTFGSRVLDEFLLLDDAAFLSLLKMLREGEISFKTLSLFSVWLKSLASRLYLSCSDVECCEVTTCLGGGLGEGLGAFLERESEFDNSILRRRPDLPIYLWRVCKFERLRSWAHSLWVKSVPLATDVELTIATVVALSIGSTFHAAYYEMIEKGLQNRTTSYMSVPRLISAMVSERYFSWRINSLKPLSNKPQQTGAQSDRVLPSFWTGRQVNGDIDFNDPLIHQDSLVAFLAIPAGVASETASGMPIKPSTFRNKTPTSLGVAIRQQSETRDPEPQEQQSEPQEQQSDTEESEDEDILEELKEGEAVSSSWSFFEDIQQAHRNATEPLLPPHSLWHCIERLQGNVKVGEVNPIAAPLELSGNLAVPGLRLEMDDPTKKFAQRIIVGSHLPQMLETKILEGLEGPQKSRISVLNELEVLGYDLFEAVSRPTELMRELRGDLEHTLGSLTLALVMASLLRPSLSALDQVMTNLLPKSGSAAALIIAGGFQNMAFKLAGTLPLHTRRLPALLVPRVNNALPKFVVSLIRCAGRLADGDFGPVQALVQAACLLMVQASNVLGAEFMILEALRLLRHLDQITLTKDPELKEYVRGFLVTGLTHTLSKTTFNQLAEMEVDIMMRVIKDHSKMDRFKNSAIQNLSRVRSFNETCLTSPDETCLS